MIHLQEISFAVAFAAGVLSFFSPCILPLLPGYFTYLGGTAVSGIRSGEHGHFFLAGRALLFITGFSFIFILLGATAGGLGTLLNEYRSLLNRIGGILIIIFGLQVTGIGILPVLARTKKFNFTLPTPGPIASILLGMAFAAGWTPCIGPVLASILLYAAGQATIQQGMLLLSFYSLGLAVPFIVAALTFESFLTLIRNFSRYLPQISLASGIILIFVGVLVFLGRLNNFSL